MTPPATGIDVKSVAEAIRDAMSSGADREELIRRMRSMGLNQIACMKMLRDIAGISLGDAKEAVHFSAAWADQRTANEALHEAAFAAAEELSYREVVSEV